MKIWGPILLFLVLVIWPGGLSSYYDPDTEEDVVPEDEPPDTCVVPYHLELVEVWERGKRSWQMRQVYDLPPGGLHCKGRRNKGNL